MSSSRGVSRERRKISQGQNLREALERGSQKSLRRMREVKGEPEKCGGISARERKHRKEGEINTIKWLLCTLWLPPQREASLATVKLRPKIVPITLVNIAPKSK